MAIRFSNNFAKDFLRENDIKGLEGQVRLAHDVLEAKSGLGNDFLGWMHLPSSITPDFITEINETAKVLREN